MRIEAKTAIKIICFPIPSNLLCAIVPFGFLLGPEGGLGSVGRAGYCGSGIWI